MEPMLYDELSPQFCTAITTLLNYIRLRYSFQNKTLLKFHVENVSIKLAKICATFPYVITWTENDVKCSIIYVSTLGIQIFRQFQTFLDETNEKVHYIILFGKNRPTTECKKQIDKLNEKNQGKTIEIYSLTELQYNIFDNTFSVRLTQDVNLKDLPMLLSTDVTARYLNLKVGNIIEFKRPDNLTYYRKIV
jgi:hypothetical protein